MRRRRARGSILLLVLVALTMMALLGAAFADAAARRSAAARAYREAAKEAFESETSGGGQPWRHRATIPDGADGASSNGAFHGSQAVSPGRVDRVGPGTER